MLMASLTDSLIVSSRLLLSFGSMRDGLSRCTLTLYDQSNTIGYIEGERGGGRVKKEEIKLNVEIYWIDNYDIIIIIENVIYMSSSSQ